VQPSLVHIPGGGDAPDSGAGDDDSVDDDGSGGGYMISGQLFWPSDTALAKLGVAAGAKLPAIVFTHGGPMRQMYAAWHYSNDYAQLYGLNQWLANKGFVVLSLNYRMGVGYGKAFRDCLPGNDCGWRGGAEYLDVKAGAEWLAALPSQDVDPARIGIHGLSYGGLNALQGLCRDAGLFAAGVANAPVFNWVSTLRFTKAPWVDYSPSLEGEAVITGPEPEFAGPSWHGKVDANIKTAWGASPAAASAGLTVPLMLVHGDLDTNVDMQETMAVMRLQREAGREDDLEMVFLADEKHWPALYETQMEVCGLTVDFFLRRLDQQQAGAGTGTSSSKLVGEAV
jgi:dipeptidyl aminopeptidase/acylaminoacyl peptidase